MCSRPLFHLALLAAAVLAAPVAHAQSAAMMVSVSVVNTCRFGKEASCAVQGTSLTGGTAILASGAPLLLVASGVAQPGQRVYHL